MSLPAVFSKDSEELRAAPINPEWIISGKPEARNRILSKSADLMACTILWDCTDGEFHWFYDIDETLHFIEGKVTIDDGQSAPRTLGPGDIIFFPKGSQAVWKVHSYIRKVAFCRRTLPTPAAKLAKIASVVKGKLTSNNLGNSLMSDN